MADQPAEKMGRMTLDELVKLYETEDLFELIEGERIDLNPVVAGHGDKSRIIHDAFAEHNRQYGTGISYFEQAYVLVYSSGWVKGSRNPEVMSSPVLNYP